MDWYGSNEVDFGCPGDEEVMHFIGHEVDERGLSAVFEGLDKFGGGVLVGIERPDFINNRQGKDVGKVFSNERLAAPLTGNVF